MLSLCLQIKRSKFLQDLIPQADLHEEGGSEEGGDKQDRMQKEISFSKVVSVMANSIGSALAREPALFSSWGIRHKI